MLGAWLVVVAAGLVLGGQVFDRLTTTDSLRPDAESQLADRRVDQLQPEGPVVVAVVGGRDVFDPALVDDITAVTAELRGMDGVAEVEDLYGAPGGRVGADNRSSLIRVELERGLPDDRRETERTEGSQSRPSHELPPGQGTLSFRTTPLRTRSRKRTVPN